MESASGKLRRTLTMCLTIAIVALCGALSLPSTAHAAPADPGQVDLKTDLMFGWAGPGTRVSVTVWVTNDGDAASSGHTLEFAPDVNTDRTVTADAVCASAAHGFRCSGGPLQPGETATYQFTISPPTHTDAYPPFWHATATGDEPDPVADNNTRAYILPDSNYISIEAKVVTRVIDIDGDGRSSPGEPAEVYVHFVNDSDSELRDVRVQLTGSTGSSRILDDPVAPGAGVTVEFDETIPDNGPDTEMSVGASVTAYSAEGGNVSADTAWLAVSGPLAAPTPGGLDGTQPKAAPYNPREFVDLDPARFLQQPDSPAQAVPESGQPDAPEQQPEPPAPAQNSDPAPEAAPARQAAAAPEPRTEPTAKPAPAPVVHPRTVAAQAPLVSTGSPEARSALIAAVALLGLGVLVLQVRITWFRPARATARR